MQAGNAWLIATLGEGQEKEREEEKAGRHRERRQRGGGGLAATFQRIIIVISLGGLDLVVLSRERG